MEEEEPRCTDLLVGGEVGEHGDDLTLDVLQLQNLGKLSQLGGGRSSNHGGVVRAQAAEVPAQHTSRKRKHQFALLMGVGGTFHTNTV